MKPGTATLRPPALWRPTCAIRPSTISMSPATRTPSTSAASTPSLTRRSISRRVAGARGSGGRRLADERGDVGHLAGRGDRHVDRRSEIGEVHRHRGLRVLEPGAVVEAHALAPHPAVVVDPDVDGSVPVHPLEELPKCAALCGRQLRSIRDIDDRTIMRRLDAVDRVGPDLLGVAAREKLLQPLLR